MFISKRFIQVLVHDARFSLLAFVWLGVRLFYLLKFDFHIALFQSGSIYEDLNLAEIALLKQSSFLGLSKRHCFQSSGFQPFLKERQDRGTTSLYASIFDNNLKHH